MKRHFRFQKALLILAFVSVLSVILFRGKFLVIESLQGSFIETNRILNYSRKFLKEVSISSLAFLCFIPDQIPIYFLIENFSTLGRIPDRDKIFIENDYWQLLHTSNGTFKMFNAYYDNRAFFKKNPLVRILAFINRVDPVVRTYCQLWFNGMTTPYTVETVEYKLIWHKNWGVNSLGSQPHLVSCVNPLGVHGFVPSSVSLVEDEFDDAMNNLKVINNLPEGIIKKPFAVCVKDLDFMDDQTLQMIEWIEIISLLGADKIFIYVIQIHPKLMNTLRYYESKGKVVIEMISEPEGLPKRNQSLTQWLQNELISLNDCFYKHINEYDYLIPLDIDEIILPVRPEDRSWMDLMQRVKGRLGSKEPRAAYVARNVFFLFDNNHENEIQPEVPAYLTFLQHIYRASNFSHLGIGSKSFQSTELVLSMHNHYPMDCIGKEFIDYTNIDIEDGKLHHYRRDCENYPKDECQGFKDNTVKDLTLWKLKDEIIANVDKAMKELKTLNDGWNI